MMGNESEKHQVAIEVNGEFIGLGEDFCLPQMTMCPGQDAAEPTNINMEFSFTLHHMKKFMRRLRWVMFKNSLASFLALFFHSERRRRSRD